MNINNANNVYLLKLQQDKYYVGKSKCVIDRIHEHKNGKGAVWTKKYPVIDIIAVHTNCDSFDEDKYVKTYMLKYGIDNVRGGAYSQVLMSDEQYDLLERELNHSQDRCMKCGKFGHFALECSQPRCNDCGRLGHASKNCPTPKCPVEIDTSTNNVDISRCYRCGRDGHIKSKCLAKTHEDGTLLPCQVCKNVGHNRRECFFKKTL
jgi:predicted GIY-YIG superfamily endonuclease